MQIEQARISELAPERRPPLHAVLYQLITILLSLMVAELWQETVELIKNAFRNADHWVGCFKACGQTFIMWDGIKTASNSKCLKCFKVYSYRKCWWLDVFLKHYSGLFIFLCRSCSGVFSPLHFKHLIGENIIHHWGLWISGVSIGSTVPKLGSGSSAGLFLSLLLNHTHAHIIAVKSGKMHADARQQTHH